MIVIARPAAPGETPPLHRPDALAGVLYKDEGPRFGIGSFRALGGAYAAVRLLARPQGGGPAIAAGESAVAGLAALIAVASDAGWRDRLGLDARSVALVIGSEGVTDPAIYDRIMAGAAR